MKQQEIKLGGTYMAKVTDQVVPVRINGENRHGGWDATNLITNKTIRIKSAQRLRGEAINRAEAKVEKATQPQAKTEQKPAKATKVKAPKPVKEPKGEKKLSCLGAAVEVLKASKEPMACKEMIDAMSSKKLWVSDAPTPAATLYSAILREIQKKGIDARFKKTERGHFALNV